MRNEDFADDLLKIINYARWLRKDCEGLNADHKSALEMISINAQFLYREFDRRLSINSFSVGDEEGLCKVETLSEDT